MSNESEVKSVTSKTLDTRWDEMCGDARLIEKILALYCDGGCTLDTLIEMLTACARKLNESIDHQGSGN